MIAVRSDCNDNSSVESDFQGENSSGFVFSLDDISVISREHRPSRFSKAGSFVSVLSTESSLDDYQTPIVSDQDGKHNATWSSNHHERYVAVSRLPDAINASANPRKGLRRNDSLSGSCNSIKEQLRFGSIHEDADYNSLGSSDVESDDESYTPSSSKYTNNLRLVVKDILRDDASETESSIEDSVINSILCNSESREQILRGGKRSNRSSKHSMRNRTPGKVKGVTGDPLLNRFLDTRREKITSTKNEEIVEDHLPTGRLEITITKKTLMFDSIMGKTDSLVHVNKQGQRIVKTKQDFRTSNSRCSAISSKDPLMERFLLSKEMQRDGRKKEVSTCGAWKVFSSCDSLQRVEGKGQRHVGTRLVC